MTKTLVTWEIRATTGKLGLKETTQLLYSKGNSKGRDLLQDGEIFDGSASDSRFISRTWKELQNRNKKRQTTQSINGLMK